MRARGGLTSKIPPPRFAKNPLHHARSAPASLAGGQGEGAGPGLVHPRLEHRGGLPLLRKGRASRLAAAVATTPAATATATDASSWRRVRGGGGGADGGELSLLVLRRELCSRQACHQSSVVEAGRETNMTKKTKRVSLSGESRDWGDSRASNRRLHIRIAFPVTRHPRISITTLTRHPSITFAVGEGGVGARGEQQHSGLGVAEARHVVQRRVAVVVLPAASMRASVCWDQRKGRRKWSVEATFG